MSSALKEVLSKALALTGKLDRNSALQFFVDAARELTGAKYCTLGIIDTHGETFEFVYSGFTPEIGKKLLSSHDGSNIFANNPDNNTLIVNNLAEYPNTLDKTIKTKYHPDLKNFLETTIYINEQIWGRLYLANKPLDFSEIDSINIEMLNKAATITIQNTKLYEESQNRARWLTASQNIVSALLEGTEPEDALQLITEQMRQAAKADIALMVLPSIQNTWVCEIVAGENAEELLGVIFPRTGRAQTVIQEQAGIVIDSMQRLSTVRLKELRRFGPALYTPLVSQGVGRGVIILFRLPGRLEFNLHDLTMAENVAKQAAIALELSEARQAQELAVELNERTRISQDLHDLAIQQLFASGMHITAVKEDLAENTNPKITKALDNAIWAIDESVTQIRKIVQSLRDDSSPAALLERLQKETSAALQYLGFAPSLLIYWHNQAVGDDFDFIQIDDAIGSDITDDVVAVVREGLSNAARHAHASSVSVEIHVDEDAIKVLVNDDGTGITRSLSRRSGLSNLAARARRHNGNFSIRPHKSGEKGTQMYWKVPLR